MADLLHDNESAPSAPAASKSILFSDVTTKKFMQMDDSGLVHGILSTNYPASGVASVALATTETYVAGSSLLLPSTGLQLGMCFRWYLELVKTGAGTAASIVKVYFGTTQSVSDSLLLTMTGVAQVGTASGTVMLVTAMVRTSGASAIITGNYNTGNPNFGSGPTGTQVSSTFNGSPGGSNYMGISVTPGASAAWTLDGVRSELIA